MSGLALELRNVTRHFGSVTALASANLSVRAGSVHVILGENGAGKTTLMRLAYGMLRPQGGTVLVDGIARAFDSPADAIAAGVGMVQQHPTSVGAMTVWENVVLGGTGRIDPVLARRQVLALSNALRFKLDPDARVAGLSIAAQQRLDILKAAWRKARVLILDEPTAILAPEEADELYGWLRSFAQGGGTAVVVTHKLDEARRYSDELTVLRGGHTVLTGTSSSFSVEALTQAMIGGPVSRTSQTRATQPAGDVVLRATELTVLDERGIARVDGATFEIRAGEIVGIAGVEGSGHHELLRAIAGRSATSGGTLTTVANEGPQGETHTHAGNVALVPEDRHRDAVVLEFSLTENAAIKGAGERRGMLRWGRMAATVAELIARFDVRAEGPHTVMRTLSGGNQQKFVLARELNGNPRLIVAENPTRGLDIRASTFVRDQLREARARGAAVVLYSSDLDEIIELADRILVMHSGRLTQVEHDRTRIGAAMLGAA